MQINYLAIVVVVVCALTFYQAGKHERSWSLLWATLSVLVSLLSLRFLKLGLVGVFVGQAGLFLAITAYRMWRKN
jgi:hypothetical protein